jgi:hypothetical protein
MDSTGVRNNHPIGNLNQDVWRRLVRRELGATPWRFRGWLGLTVISVTNWTSISDVSCGNGLFIGSGYRRL